jgi:hypothetical protein
MTSLAQQLAIAKRVGWHDFTSHKVQGCVVWYGWHPQFNPIEVCRYETPLPDYLGNLNAMFKAEETLDKLQQRRYFSLLTRKWLDKQSSVNRFDWQLLHVSANRRAQAFLKVCDLWID